MAESNPKWRSKSDPSVVVELMSRDVHNATYRDRNGVQVLAIDEFDDAFEPVLPTVKMASVPQQPTSSGSRTAPDGSPIPADPTPGPNQMANAISSLQKDIRAQGDALRKMGDQIAAIHAIISPPPLTSTPPPVPPRPEEKDRQGG